MVILGKESNRSRVRARSTSEVSRCQNQRVLSTYYTTMGKRKKEKGKRNWCHLIMICNWNTWGPKIRE